MDFIKEALTLGFNNAAVIDVKDLVFVLEYRQFCEENLCGNFNVLSSCPPACGTPEEMHRKALNYKKALILQTVLESPEEQFDVKKAKYNHNILTEKLYKKWKLTQKPLLCSSAPGLTNVFPVCQLTALMPRKWLTLPICCAGHRTKKYVFFPCSCLIRKIHKIIALTEPQKYNLTSVRANLIFHNCRLYFYSFT